MLIRATMLIATILYIFLDAARDKTGISTREKIVYIVMAISILYLAIIFIAAPSWPNLDELMRILLDRPSRSFVGLFSLG